jgi:hypothetical protein
MEGSSISAAMVDVSGSSCVYRYLMEDLGYGLMGGCVEWRIHLVFLECGVQTSG